MNTGASKVAYAERAVVLGARVGFTVGISLVLAEIITLMVPAASAKVVYAVAGGTLALLLWKLTGRIFSVVGRAMDD